LGVHFQKVGAHFEPGLQSPAVSSSTSPPTVAEDGTDTVVTIDFGGTAAEGTDYVLRVALTSRCR